MENKNKKIITLLTVFAIIFTVIGSSLAYFRWQTATGQETNVTFTVASDFTCSADGGDLSNGNVSLAPTTCDNENYVIKREITLSPRINSDDKTIYMDLWLDIESLDPGLENNKNFKWVLSNSASSCTGDAIENEGTFENIEESSQVMLLDNEAYTKATQNVEPYYLYIWLDKEETSTSTMNQNFSFKLNGECTDIEPLSGPEVPTLDNGLIPVILSDDATNGYKVTATTVDDPNWYSYGNKQWANAVLVKEEGVKTRTENKVPTTEIDTDDILAYFVWVPRYKYRMPGTKCSAIEGVNENDNLRCYSVVLNSEDDKNSLIQGVYYLALQEGFILYTMTEAQNEVEEGLETGIFNSPTLGFLGLPMTEMLAMYSNLAGVDIDYELQFNPNLIDTTDTSVPGMIDIIFEDNSIEFSLGDTVSTYRTHPAFWWDENGNRNIDSGETLDGFWVGKFETTGDVTTPTVLPNTIPLDVPTISAQFTTAMKFSGGIMTKNITSYASSTPTYGLTSSINAHMMKNSEWGAVTYLSQSQYGINKEIRINNYYSSGAITGCGATEENANASTTCSNAYASGISSYPQSTTGNITGIFDISGGTWETVMGNYANMTSYSGFDSGWFTESSNQKYYDLYSFNSSTSCTIETCGGHALFETESWYNDGADFVNSNNPWFLRGGNVYHGVNAGAFFFLGYNGDVDSGYTGFRSVLSR